MWLPYKGWLAACNALVTAGVLTATIVLRPPFIVAILVLLSSALHIDILLAIKLRYLHPKHLASRRTQLAAERCRRCSR